MHFGLSGRHEHEHRFEDRLNRRRVLNLMKKRPKLEMELETSDHFLQKCLLFKMIRSVLSKSKIYKEYLRRRPQDTLTPESRFYLTVKQNPDDVWFKRQPIDKTVLGV